MMLKNEKTFVFQGDFETKTKFIISSISAEKIIRFNMATHWISHSKLQTRIAPHIKHPHKK